MKSFIRQRLREQIIDGQEMNEPMQTMCNKISIDSYEEALSYVEASIKGLNNEARTRIMQKIHVPLENLKQEQIKLAQEKNDLNMTGDSLPDQADTYWHQIQTTICEMGPNFQ